MTELLRSRIAISEPDPRIPTFPSTPSAVYGVIGITEMGPIGTPTKVTSYEEFENTYGGFINGYFTNLAVRAFFLNGGKQCWITRTVHYTDITSSSTQTAVKGAVTLPTSGGEETAGEITGTVVGPWELSNGDTLIGNTDGVGNQTATFSAATASVECATAETYDFSTGGEELTVKINQGTAQTITFQTSDFAAPAAGTAEEVAVVINNQIINARAFSSTTDTKVTIETDRLGTGAYVEVTGGDANTILGFSTSEVQGTGNVSDITAVTISEVETIVEAAFTNGGGVAVTSDSGKAKISSVTLGSGGSIRIDSTSTTATVFGFTTDTTYSGSDSAAQDTLTMTATYYGDYTDGMSIKIADASNADSGKFNLSVITSTETLESFVNLSMDSDNERYAVDYINNEDYGSIYFTASDEEATGAESVIRPANTSGASVTGGVSGLTDLADTDFTGDLDAKTGIFAMNDADDLTLVSCPERTSTTVHNAVNTYCSDTRNRQVLAILDPPASQTASEIVTHKQALTATESGALYWPRIKILNPSTTVFGNDSQLTVPPSGHLAGMYARNDANTIEGPFYQPAGTDGVGSLYGAVDLETTEAIDPNKLDLVYPERINPITYTRNHGIHADGTRTLKGTGNFPSIGERRGVSYIEWQLDNGLQWVRHRNNTPALRRKVERQVKGLLFGWMKRNAFQSMNSATAYFVDVSDALNTASVVRSGKLKIRIGLATNTPTDWVLIDVTKDTRALEEELLAAGA